VTQDICLKLNKSEVAADSRQVWDLLVRITHWLVAGAVIFNFFSDTGWVHRYVGYLAATLVLLRLVYGLPVIRNVINSGHAAHLKWPAPSEIFHHLAEIRSGVVSSPDGHNPLGYLAAYMMWLLVLLLAFSGWLAGTDQYWGEDWPVDLHIVISYVLEAMVVIHLAAIVVMSKLQKESLLKAMLTGNKSSR